MYPIQEERSMDWIVKLNGNEVFVSNMPGAKAEAAIRFANVITRTKDVGGQVEIGNVTSSGTYRVILSVAV